MSAACHNRWPRSTVGGALTDRIPQLEGTLEVTERCGRSDRLCRIGGGEQRRERRLDVACTVEVERQLAGTVRSSQHVGRLLLQRCRDAAVQAGSLRWQQVGVHDFAEQRVAEAVGVVVDDQQPCVDHGPHCGFEVVLGQVDDRGEQLVARVAADRRDRAQHQSCAVVEIGDLGGDQVGEHDGDGLARQVRGDELAGEERVAATARDHLVDQRARRRPAEQRGDALRRSRRGPALPGGFDEPPAAGSARPADPVGSGGRRPRWHGRCRPGPPARRSGCGRGTRTDPTSPCRPSAGLRTRRSLRSSAASCVISSRTATNSPPCGEPCSSGAAAAGCEPVLQRRERRRLAQQHRVRPPHLAQQIGEWRERDGVAADVRGPPQVQADAGTRRALADDRGLADAGVAADQHDRRQPVACIRDGALERGQLGAPADEVRCGQAVVDDAAQYRVPPLGTAPCGSRSARARADLRGCGRCERATP